MYSGDIEEQPFLRGYQVPLYKAKSPLYKFLPPSQKFWISTP